MAVRQPATSTGAGARRTWFVAACLVALFVAALFLRAYWNLDAANPADGTYVLSGGSDPYYHKYAADAIQANGFEHHKTDALLNYPAGYDNPNPPLYEWIIAAGGQFLAPLFGGSVETATWEVAIWSPAILGALTLIPIYFLGAALFDRRVGLVAALLWVVSTSAIDATGLGLADHDAAVVFFATLAFLFYVQSIRHFRGEGNWIARWSNGSAIASGVGRLFRERHAGFAFALLSAVSIAALALTWKGFNYVVAIILLYAGMQMVADHFRNRDSTGLFLGTLAAAGVGVLLALPYYFGTGVANFLTPTWFLLGGFIVGGLILVPTRDLPSILVLPAAAVFTLLAAVVAFFLMPGVAQSLLYSLVYFKQTRLYTTISEAQPADFSTIAFGIGPLAFFLAIFGWFVLLFRVAARPVQAWIATTAFLLAALIAYISTSTLGDGLLSLPIVGLILLTWLLVMFSMSDTAAGRAHSFALLWAAVALFMAGAMAVRFVINAIPILAIFAAFMAVWVLDWLDFAAIRKSLAANRGNFWQGLRKGTRPLHVIAAILIALLFVFPTTLFAADAALPPTAEDRIARGSDSTFVQNFFRERMGAYGGGFETVAPWIPAFEWLDAHDAGIAPKDRGAFLAWWDYGHWAAAIGHHPTVADNFQNGYIFAAYFLLAKNETHAIQLLAGRLVEELDDARAETLLSEAGVADARGARETLEKMGCQRNDETYCSDGFLHELDLEASADLLKAFEEASGKKIRYVAGDIRMLPYDNPQSPSIEVGSIFGAPVKLKGEDPDAYVTTTVNTGNEFVTTKRYRELASNPIDPAQLIGYRLEYQPDFFDTMFWRTYVGTPVQPEQGQQVIVGSDVDQSLGNPRPGLAFEHFRTVYVGDVTRIYRGGGDPNLLSSYLFYPEIIISEYFHGATLTGTLTEEGTPLAGVTVTVFDDTGKLIADAYGRSEFGFNVDPETFRVPHATTTTAADGTYSLRAPFSMEGSNLTVVATRGGVEVARQNVSVTREQAEKEEVISGVDLTALRGVVDGFAFTDSNGNGVFEEGNDTRLTNVNFTIGNVEVVSGDDGSFRATGVSAGLQTVTSGSPEVSVVAGSRQVRVVPGSNVTHNVGFEPTPARLNGRVIADPENGTESFAAPFLSMTFTAVENTTAKTVRNVNTDAVGNLSVSLSPGSYTVSASWEKDGVTYVLERPIQLAPGETREDELFTLTRAP